MICRRSVLQLSPPAWAHESPWGLGQSILSQKDWTVSAECPTLIIMEYEALEKSDFPLSLLPKLSPTSLFGQLRLTLLALDALKTTELKPIFMQVILSTSCHPLPYHVLCISEVATYSIYLHNFTSEEFQLRCPKLQRRVPQASGFFNSLEAEPRVMPVQPSHPKLLFHLPSAEQDSDVLKGGDLHAQFTGIFAEQPASDRSIKHCFWRAAPSFPSQLLVGRQELAKI